MPDGNITQYTQMNPSANRPMLVCADRPVFNMGDPLTTVTTACLCMPWADVSPWIGYLAWQHNSGGQAERISELAC